MAHSLLLAALVLNVLLLSIMLGKKKKLTADQFLIVYLAFEVLFQIYQLTESTEWMQHSYWMLFGKGFYLLDSPLFFLYVHALTHNSKVPWWLYTVAVVPWMLFALHFFYFNSFVFPAAYVHAETGLVYLNGNLSWSWALFAMLLLAIEPIYLIWFYFVLKKYRLRLHHAVSKIDNLELSWLKLLFYLRCGIVLVLVPLGVAALTNGWIELSIFQWMLQLSGVVFFFMVGYFGFRQTTIFTGITEGQVEKQPAAYERSGLSPEQAQHLHQQLLAYMQSSKAYLQSDLTAAELAKAMNCTVNHLSQTLNTVQQQNFFDFVNTYRVEEVKKRLTDNRYAHLTILAIALDCGFNSKSAFNTVFKKITGLTPSQYVKGNRPAE